MYCVYYSSMYRIRLGHLTLEDVLEARQCSKLPSCTKAASPWGSRIGLLTFRLGSDGCLGTPGLTRGTHVSSCRYAYVNLKEKGYRKTDTVECMHAWMDGWMMDGCMHVGMCGCADDLFVRTRPCIYRSVGYPSVDPSLYPYNISCFYACIYRWHW